ncbi:hypothetical protein SASPL_140656 [Salvia splendens]|uniref:Uncharacterized protein n=1 Tax=Salvia splendens TaxID=180675 RepID=A0A8X8WP67_SALSN|nr:hypothetical protein SASPL_140656 [Salvia splendens]
MENAAFGVLLLAGTEILHAIPPQIHSPKATQPLPVHRQSAPLILTEQKYTSPLIFITYNHHTDQSTTDPNPKLKIKHMNAPKKDKEARVMGTGEEEEQEVREDDPVSGDEAENQAVELEVESATYSVVPSF